MGFVLMGVLAVADEVISDRWQNDSVNNWVNSTYPPNINITGNLSVNGSFNISGTAYYNNDVICTNGNSLCSNATNYYGGGWNDTGSVVELLNPNDRVNVHVINFTGTGIHTPVMYIKGISYYPIQWQVFQVHSDNSLAFMTESGNAYFNIWSGDNNNAGLTFFGADWRSYIYSTASNDLRMKTNAGGKIIIGEESAGNIILGGNSSTQKVGVGTSMATTNNYGMLNVNGKITSESEFLIDRVSGDTTDYVTFVQRESGATCNFGLTETGCAELYTYSDDASTNAFLIGTYNSEPLIFATNNAEKMRITPSGSVGIGTVVPSHQLVVQGTPSAYDGNNFMINSTASYGGFALWRSSTGLVGSFSYGDDGNIFTGASSQSTSIRAENSLHLGGGGDKLTMTLNNSRVGIGTTQPSERLDVNGNIRVTGNLNITNTIYLADLQVSKKNGNLLIKNNNSENISLKISPMAEMYWYNNTIPTDISAIKTWTKVNGSTYMANMNSCMNMTDNNTMQYLCPERRMFHMAATFSVYSAGSNDVILLGIFKNGVLINNSIVKTKLGLLNDITSTAIHTAPILSQFDNISLYIVNDNDADDLTVAYANIFMMGMTIGED